MAVPLLGVPEIVVDGTSASPMAEHWELVMFKIPSPKSDMAPKPLHRMPVYHIDPRHYKTGIRSKQLHLQ